MGNLDGGWKRCGGCGRMDTGWRAVVKGGARLCPACAYGIRVVPVRDMLEERRALLARLEAKDDPHPGTARFRAEVRCGIDTLERRLRDDGG